MRKHWLVAILLVFLSIQIQAQNGWTRKDSLPTPRSGATASVVDNKIYVMGGLRMGPTEVANNEVYDPSTNTWDTLAPMPAPRGFLTSEVVNGTICAIGGSYSLSATRSIFAYDPPSNFWITMEDMSGPRLGMRAGVVNGKIYVVGGNYNQDSCFEYDPSSNLWTPKRNRPGGGGALSVTVYNGLVYAFGGSTYPPWVPLSTVNAYNPQTDTWISKRNMPTPRFCFQTYLVGDKIYAIGGSQVGYDAISTVEVYDPVRDTWDTTRPDMPFASSLFAGVAVNNKIYVIGGTTDWVTGGAELWEYDPPVVGVEQETNIAERFVLLQSYPNPFNPNTTIKYELASASHVTLKIYNTLGLEVATLVNEIKQPGTYTVQWNASGYPSGVYFYRIQAGGFTSAKPLILLK